MLKTNLLICNLVFILGLFFSQFLFTIPSVISVILLGCSLTSVVCVMRKEFKELIKEMLF